MTGAELITIAGAATVLAVTPGPETILTVRLSALRRKAGLIYSLGSATGMTVWMIAALTGISALLTTFPSALLVLKVVGGLYLCFLGILAARQALRIRAELRGTPPRGQVSEIAAATDDLVISEAVDTGAVVGASDVVSDGAVVGTGTEIGTGSEVNAAPDGKKSWGQLRSVISYRRGLISSLSNPKAGLFFLAVMPTLVPSSAAGADYLLLVSVVIGLMLAYQILLAFIAGMAAAALQRRSTDFYIEAVSAVVLVVMGIAVIAIPV
ncbi:LysE family translocator [Micrococcaceae sp. AOP34-BR2-30]|uniref:LysE family translocator n=1 Tax=Brevibacterium aurantiacum TaxID=273384 RepID=A0A2H1J833_BREAU|nr:MULTISPECIES: LysE family translocator [Brevibacterium]MDN5551895.1 LysE family translocator [Brevibacterium sp.]MDN6605971.1 LysE family translocator [Brevibacterium sp.]TGD40585.1 LysE family translocator [Brevibacterium aurantiacum]SMX83488.1 LysE type translocator [Brevibacterium aurantiacum]SMX98966.1 LysE type translocator [Brevibacterium aurantiacum]